MAIIYFKDEDVVKGRFENCDTNSVIFNNMTRIEKNDFDAELDDNFENFRSTLPPSVDTELEKEKSDYTRLTTNAEKISFLAKKFGLE